MPTAEKLSQLSTSVAAFALAGGVSAVYSATCCPTVPGGDSGELIVTAHLGGVAHPPGYPLFTMIGYIASHAIPFGSVAWRVNMTSVVYSTGAAVFLYLSILCYLRLRDDQPTTASVRTSGRDVRRVRTAQVRRRTRLHTFVCLAGVGFCQKARQWESAAQNRAVKTTSTGVAIGELGCSACVVCSFGGMLVRVFAVNLALLDSGRGKRLGRKVLCRPSRP